MQVLYCSNNHSAIVQIKDMVDDSTSSSEGDEDVVYVYQPPAKKCFHHLESVIQQKWKESLKKTSKQRPGQIELDHYLSTTESAQDNVDVLQYWDDLHFQYPLLSKIAVDVLVIPASSAPVERVFYTAREACIGRRNRLTNSNLETKVLIKRNKHYIWSLKFALFATVYNNGILMYITMFFTISNCSHF